jgi:hypothetical protein
LQNGHLIIDSYGNGRFKLIEFYMKEPSKPQLKAIFKERAESFEEYISIASDASLLMVFKILFNLKHKF